MAQAKSVPISGLKGVIHNVGHEESIWNQLDGRLPDQSLILEMKNTGKSAEQIRTERGEGSLVDLIITKMEKRYNNKPGGERA